MCEPKNGGNVERKIVDTVSIPFFVHARSADNIFRPPRMTLTLRERMMTKLPEDENEELESEDSDSDEEEEEEMDPKKLAELKQMALREALRSPVEKEFSEKAANVMAACQEYMEAKSAGNRPGQ